ncbi:MAG: carboxymuconolactone decarboxylase [Bacteroidetes bacterium]|jgi:alkylhydroperoxidase/carboxymuconolactone decarboxylase family protein YurZ|nr:carboxymuconolactone decarboxylase [Bacteroidota bacterium]
MKKSRTKILISFIVAISCFSLDLKAQTSIQNQRFSDKQQGLIPIAAYTAIGDLQSLKPALHKGLDAGLTVNEIKESMVHLYAYAGFPRSIRGLNTFMEVLEERETEGINDEQGPEASPIKDDREKYERGVETLYELTGSDWANPQSGYGAFAPAIDTFLKEHLFADLFERDVLTYAERELVVISILSSLDGLEPMLGSHFNLSLNVGLTSGQLQHFVDIIESTLGDEKGEVAQSVLDRVLEIRNQE